MCSAQDRGWRLGEARGVFSTGYRLEAEIGKECVRLMIEGRGWKRQGVCSAQDREWRLREAKGVFGTG